MRHCRLALPSRQLAAGAWAGKEESEELWQTPVASMVPGDELGSWTLVYSGSLYSHGLDPYLLLQPKQLWPRPLSTLIASSLLFLPLFPEYLGAWAHIVRAGASYRRTRLA